MTEETLLKVDEWPPALDIITIDTGIVGSVRQCFGDVALTTICCCDDTWSGVDAEDIAKLVTLPWDLCLLPALWTDCAVVRELWLEDEAVISESLAAKVCDVLLVTTFDPLLAVIIAFVYDIVVFVLDDDMGAAATD